jgi:hypothetical protein
MLAQCRLDFVASEGDALYLEAYETYIASWAMTTAHETVHAFLTYLAGHKAALTPTEVAPLDDENTVRGESGRVWELRTFGGMQRIRKNCQERFLFKKSPPVRAGSIWLKTDTGTVARISREAIANLVRGSKLANLPTHIAHPPLFTSGMSPAWTDITEQSSSFPYRPGRQKSYLNARNTSASLVCEKLRRCGGSTM